MDSTRALLDALMGPNRNQQKTTTDGGEPEFVEKTICKHYLVGFCPHDWITAKGRTLQACNKIHSDLMREQFESHPDGKYRAEYEEDFHAYLEKVVLECDGFISRERPKCRQKGAKDGVNLPRDIKEKYHELEKRYGELVQMSQDMADESLSKSEEKMKQALQVKEELESIRSKNQIDAGGEDICEVCGVKYPVGGGMDWHDKQSHMKGKTHQAFLKIRAKAKELRGKRKEWDKYRKEVEKERQRQKDKEKKESKREREKEKEREREREKAREKEREKDRELEKKRLAEKERLLEIERQRQREKAAKKAGVSVQETKKDQETKKEKKRKGSSSSSSSGSGKSRRKKSKDRKNDKDRERSRSPRREEEEGELITIEDIPALWDSLGGLSAEAREEAIKQLSEETQDLLEDWLIARVTAKRNAAASG